MQNIEAERTIIADENDVLSTTQLRQAPGPGAVAVYLASTVADTLATVIVGGRVLKNDEVVSKVGTNAQIDALADTPLVQEVRGGEAINVNVNVVTAGTVRVKAIWVGELL